MQIFLWPAVVLILGLVVLFTFRKSIERLIDRTQKISKSGLETGQVIQTTSVEAPVSKADDLLKQFDNALLVKTETEIGTWLDNAHLPPGGERERVLVRHLAGLVVAATFERIYSQIWGSQIRVLQFLSGSAGVQPDFFRQWFEARQPVFLPGDTLERWLSFLVGFQLIAKVGNNVVITLEGREFLKFVIHQGYTLYKVG